MFVDELTIQAEAGRGGDGVVRWRREKFIPKGGPSGGNGGRGGSVFVRAVRDVGVLSKYTGAKTFKALAGEPGATGSKSGKDGLDLYIDVPIGSTIREHEREREYTLLEEGEVCRILQGGRGGLGNEYFKSSTNRTPEESTKGASGERGTFTIEVSLIVDVGLIGLPNAGKSTLINALTNTRSKIGAYPFTTTEPHLGDLYGYIIADIPGLIEGASEGKGLGHKFLRHVSRTKMLAHCVSLEHEDPYYEYERIRTELKAYDPSLLEKEEWIILTKADTQAEPTTQEVLQTFTKKGHSHVYVVSASRGEGVKELSDTLTRHLTTLKK